MPDAPPIRFRLLGRFAVDLGGNTPRSVEITGRLRRALLGYLAMQPDFSETRERLAALLWGESPDKQARQNLRQCLLDLRRELEIFGCDPLKIDRERIGLRGDLIAVDVRELLDLSRSDAAVDLGRAVSLYSGPLLDGLDVDTGSFRDWVAAERAHVASAAALVFEKYASKQDDARNGTQALAAAERLVALDPLRESAQRLMIRLLARYQGRDAALERAAALTTLLQSDLNAAPEPETVALTEEIRRGKPDRSASITVRPATGPRVAVEPGTPLPPMRRSLFALSLTKRWIVGATAIIATGALMIVFVHDRFKSPPQGINNGAVVDSDSWRSPKLATGVSADSAGLATRGLYPIVVLPFATDAEAGTPQARLARRVSDDLISDLSRSINTRVISAQTSRLYEGRPVDVAAVGAELGVRYVVEGNVRIENARLRINAALTDVSTRLQVWSDRFDYDETDHASIQEDITRSITRRLQINLVGVEDRRRPPRRGAEELGIADLLAKGWAATLRISAAEKTTGADTYFAEVLKRDPDNASALTGLGAFRVTQVTMYLADERTVDLVQAERHLSRAIELEPAASLPHYYLGMLEKVRARPHAALAEFARVLQNNPSYAPAYAQVGHVLSRIGRLDEALEHVRYALRLSPKDHNVGIWSLFGGQIELERGHDQEALDWLLRAFDAAPRNPFIPASLAAVYALRGEHGASARYALETRKLAPWLTIDLMLQRLVGLSEKGAEPRRLIEGLNLAFSNAG